MQKNSCIKGEGYGSTHSWKSETRNLEYFYPDHMKMTVYTCEECGVMFVHYYDVTTDIFKAMKKCDVPEKCIIKEEILRKVRDITKSVNDIFEEGGLYPW